MQITVNYGYPDAPLINHPFVLNNRVCYITAFFFPPGIAILHFVLDLKIQLSIVHICVSHKNNKRNTSMWARLKKITFIFFFTLQLMQTTCFIHVFSWVHLACLQRKEQEDIYTYKTEPSRCLMSSGFRILWKCCP